MPAAITRWQHSLITGVRFCLCGKIIDVKLNDCRMNIIPSTGVRDVTVNGDGSWGGHYLYETNMARSFGGLELVQMLMKPCRPEKQPSRPENNF